ncbi:hypothetical protein DE4585_04766 [Mycobacteroides salmoniphilum]|uniref:Uncharacterized protein n=1 Tax=Mycobacteroides salmoniphilum TaxID=404941 RepID=A0A4R8RZF3_9MYCO|nr:hypothetical protein [Mycobacteroides salmoniphilum]TDZ77372.1 hypothetical protein DE4585_04766 [Mycobacteroides salmoniphilum]
MSEEPLDVETVDSPEATAKPGETQPAAEPKAAEKADGARVSGDSPKKSGARTWTAGRVGTQMGVPPSALRNLKTGPVQGVKGLAKAQWNAGQYWAGKLGGTVAKTVPTAGAKALAKGAARLIPGVGSIVAGYEAYQAFKEGDYVSSVLNLIGVIPGPIGWIGMGAAVAWDLSGVGHPGVWEAPDGVSTFMLPASAKDSSGVKELDALLREAQQQQVFSFQDGPAGTVWNASPPKALRVDTPEVEKAFTDWLRGVSELFAEIDRMMSQSDEPYFHQYRQELAPHFAAMAELKGHVKPLMTQLSAASKSGADMYRAVLDTNKAARQQLANDGHLSDQGPASAMKAKADAAQTQLDAANDKIGKLFDTVPAPIITAKSPILAAPAAPSTKPAPLPLSATVPPALPPPEKKLESKGDDLGKLLSGLGNKGLGAGGGSPLGGSPLGGGHGGGTPLTSPTPKQAETEPKKLVDDKKEDTKKREEKSLPKPLPTNNPVVAGAPAPTPPPPGAPAPGVPKPAAGPPDTTVDVKGKKIHFPDAKTAKMAKLLAAADPNHPISLADAAAQSGLQPPVPGQDPGKQIPPADVKPGDVMVAGDKQYMVLGDGKFYDLSQYKTIGASELPHDMGSRAGYFRLGDPGAAAAGGAGPVSGPTSGVPFSVPGATDTPSAPADTSPPAAPPGQPVGAAHSSAKAPQSVPSEGSPGVPKQGGAAPANAAATNTGAGSSVPSSTVQNLDPSAVK